MRVGAKSGGGEKKMEGLVSFSYPPTAETNGERKRDQDGGRECNDVVNSCECFTKLPPTVFPTTSNKHQTINGENPIKLRGPINRTTYCFLPLLLFHAFDATKCYSSIHFQTLDYHLTL